MHDLQDRLFPACTPLARRTFVAALLNRAASSLFTKSGSFSLHWFWPPGFRF